MKFTKQKGASNSLSDIKGPNDEYFSILKLEDKSETTKLYDSLGELVGINNRASETALVYNVHNGFAHRKFAIKAGDIRKDLEKAEDFDDAIEIFFKHPAKFTDWSNITTAEEYFGIK